jgi:hypothetical protein
MSDSKSVAQHYVELILAGNLHEFSQAEMNALDDVGCRAADGSLPSSARIAVRGRSDRMIVSSPHLVGDSLIQFYTPAGQESCCVLPVDVIEGLYFTQ